LAEDRLRPLEPRTLEPGMRHDGGHGAHLVGALRVVLVGQQEHTAGELLAYPPSKVRAAVARVERADIRIRLLETRMLAARDREVAHDVQRVAAARRPPGHERDDDLRHEADEALHLEDVQASRSHSWLRSPRSGRLETSIAVLVPAAPADALVAARAERPAAVLRDGAVAGEQHDADARILARVVEGAREFVDRLRTEGVAHLRPVERDARDAAGDIEVVGDVAEGLEAGHLAPDLGVEQLRDGHSAPIQVRRYSSTTGFSSTPTAIAAMPHPRPQFATTATIPASTAKTLSPIAEYDRPTPSSSSPAREQASATAQVITMRIARPPASAPGQRGRRASTSSGSSSGAISSAASDRTSKISRPGRSGPIEGSLTPPP